MLSIIGTSCSTTNATNTANSTSYTSNGIFFQLSTNKTHYKMGEDVLIITYVENQTAEDFRYTTNSVGSHLTIRITPPNESGIAFYTVEGGWTSGSARLDVVGGGKIESGDKISLDATWNQKLYFYGGGYQGELLIVEPGQYTVKALFDASSFEPLILDIWIDG